MKQNTLYILVLYISLVIHVVLGLPTLTNSVGSTVLPQSDFNEETTPILARQEEAEPTGTPGLPPIDEDSDEDEEEVTERDTTVTPVVTRRKVATSDFGHVRPESGIGTNAENPFGVKNDELENEVQEEAVLGSSTAASSTLKSSSTDTEGAVETANLATKQILEYPKTSKPAFQAVTPQPVTSNLSTFHHEWIVTTGNESIIESKPVLTDEKVENGLIISNSESSIVRESDELQRGGVTENLQVFYSSTSHLLDNATSSDFERDWALATGDEILSDPQARAGCECGKVPFKVSDAGVNQWPWTGAIVTNGIFAGGRPHCGATLINSKYVLTAAHCVDGLLPYRTQVWLTVHDNLQNSVSSSGTLKLEVEKILMHPNYNRRTNENDIALVALVEPVSIGQSYFVPACVPAGKNEYAEFVGRMAAWGASELGPYNTRVTNNKICKMDMPILSNDVCDRDTTHKGRITKTMLCAGFLTPKNNAACVSDAGGGLIISNGGRHTLVGITSYGYTPNRAYSPTVHTRVSEYAEWILHNSLDADWCD